MTRGVDHFLRYICYEPTPTNLCFSVASKPGWVLEMIALSLGPFLLYVMI